MKVENTLRRKGSRAAAALLILCGSACAQEAPAPRQALPPAPKGRATVIGGRVGRLDPVRDQFDLEIYGTKPFKVLYDARTELYRDGVRAPRASLRPEERASVETTLDGTAVFALKIHILSATPESDCSGQVQAFDAAGGLLEVVCREMGAPVTLRITKATEITAGKQAAPGGVSLRKGDLVKAAFSPGTGAQTEAASVTILAHPGSAFTFTGELVSLDIPAGRMTVSAPLDDTSYALTFTPGAFPGPADLKEGAQVTVTASFNGTGYAAGSVQRR